MRVKKSWNQGLTEFLAFSWVLTAGTPPYLHCEKLRKIPLIPGKEREKTTF